MPKSTLVEKEKISGEPLHESFAKICFLASVGAYLTIGQIIPGFI